MLFFALLTDFFLKVASCYRIMLFHIFNLFGSGVLSGKTMVLMLFASATTVWESVYYSYIPRTWYLAELQLVTARHNLSVKMGGIKHITALLKDVAQKCLTLSTVRQNFPDALSRQQQHEQ